MSDDRGVLGNLPKERPGRRSAKRSGASPPPPRRERPPAAETASSDPVSEAIRTATGVAAVGARVANGLARELVRRLPRI